MKSKNIATGKFEELPAKLPRWRSQYNRHLFPTWSERNDMPSMTKPDMTMTIEEIIARSTRGLKMEHMLRVPIYEGTDRDSDDQVVAKYIPDVLHMDPVDQQAYKKQIDLQVNTYKARLRAIDKANKDLAKKLSRLKDLDTEEEDIDDEQTKTPTPSVPAPAKGKAKGAKA